MSYRELRNFTEMMRALGYNRLISMENFRQPNFDLVAEILLWLVKRYDPNAEIPFEIETEQDRVIFIKSIVQYMANTAYIRLNSKWLYQADGYAVKELLKITSLLYTARVNLGDDNADTDRASVAFDITAKVNDLGMARQLATEITQKGVSLFELLGKETGLREQRGKVLGKQIELSDIEKGIRAAVEAVGEETRRVEENLRNVASDEATLDEKIEKKKTDLERNQKRLETLSTVKPAYQEEYERLEEEIERVYDAYVNKFRNVSSLEGELELWEKGQGKRFSAQEQERKKKAVEMDLANLGSDQDENFEDDFAMTEGKRPVASKPRVDESEAKLPAKYGRHARKASTDLFLGKIGEVLDAKSSDEEHSDAGVGERELNEIVEVEGTDLSGGGGVPVGPQGVGLGVVMEEGFGITEGQSSPALTLDSEQLQNPSPNRQSSSKLELDMAEDDF